eukprot:PhM_4_TR10009/c1_g1_i3/m.90310
MTTAPPKTSLKTTGFAIAALHTLPMLVLACVVAALGFKALDDDDDDLVRSILISVVVLCPLFSMLASGLTIAAFQHVRRVVDANSNLALLQSNYAPFSECELLEITSHPSYEPTYFSDLFILGTSVIILDCFARELALYVPKNVIKKIRRKRAGSVISRSTPAGTVSLAVDTSCSSDEESPRSRRVTPQQQPTRRSNSYEMSQESPVHHDSMKTKQATVMVVHIEGGFADFIETEHAKILFTVMNYMLSLFRQHDGEVINFSFRSYTVLFPPGRSNPLGQNSACACALEVSSYLDKRFSVVSGPQPRWGIALTSGAVMCGDMGDEYQRAAVIHGFPVSLALDLVRLNFQLGTRTILSEHVFDTVQSQVTAVLVDYVPGNTEHNTIAVYELRGFREELDNIEMEIQSAAMTAYNEGFSRLRIGAFSEAAAKFQEYLESNEDDKQGKRLMALCNLFHDPYAVEIAALPPIYHRRQCNWMDLEGIQVPMRSPFSPGEADISPEARRHTALSPNNKSFRAFARGSIFNNNNHAHVHTSGDDNPPAEGRMRSMSLQVVRLLKKEISQAQHGVTSPGEKPDGRADDSMSVCGSLMSMASTGGNRGDRTTFEQLATIKTEFLDRDSGRWKRSDRVLGKGAFGEVYMGMRATDGLLVAMKTLPIPRKLCDKMGLTAANSRRVRRDPNAEIQRELDALIEEVTLLSDVEHANVVSCHSTAVVGTFVVIIMEYVAGGSLMDIVKSFKTLPVPSVQRYTTDVLSGLAFLHANGIIHRDVKPHNVLLAVDGTAKLSDFGAAVHQSKIKGNTVVGTPQYIAPEQAKGAAVLASDIWSLGIMVVQLLVGELPYTFEQGNFNAVRFMRQLAYEESISPEIPEILPPVARDFVSQCLKRDPSERATASDLLQHAFLHTDFFQDDEKGIDAGTGTDACSELDEALRDRL